MRRQRATIYLYDTRAEETRRHGFAFRVWKVTNEATIQIDSLVSEESVENWINIGWTVHISKEKRK